MGVLYLDEYGAKVRIRGGLLQVEVNGETRAQLRLGELEAVVVQENCSFTSAVMLAFLKNGIECFFVDSGGCYAGKLEPVAGKNIALRKKQYQLSDQAEFAVGVARHFVMAKILNMRTVLMRYARSRPGTLQPDAARLKKLADDAAQAANLGLLRGIEGTAAREYFRCLGHIVPEPFRFNGRNRRPPADPVNAMLSFGYALLENAVEIGVSAAALDPYCGFLHRDAYGRQGLVLDLMEELRPVVPDSVVLSCCSRKMLSPDADFEEKHGGVYLNEQGRQKFFRAFHGRLKQQVTLPGTSKPVTYQALCAIQARKLASCIARGVPDYRPFLVK